MNAIKAGDGKGKWDRRERFFRISVVAEVLDISERSAARLIEAGELSVVRVGRCVRVSEAELLKFIEKGGTK